MQTSLRIPVPPMSLSCLPQHVDFDFSFFPHGHKIVTVSLPNISLRAFFLFLLLRRNTSQKPPLPLPQHLPSGLTDEIYHTCVRDGYMTDLHHWMEAAGCPLRLGCCWALTLSRRGKGCRWITTRTDSVETPTGMQF